MTVISAEQMSAAVEAVERLGGVRADMVRWRDGVDGWRLEVTVSDLEECRRLVRSLDRVTFGPRQSRRYGLVFLRAEGILGAVRLVIRYRVDAESVEGQRLIDEAVAS